MNPNQMKKSKSSKFTTNSTLRTKYLDLLLKPSEKGNPSSTKSEKQNVNNNFQSQRIQTTTQEDNSILLSPCNNASSNLADTNVLQENLIMNNESPNHERSSRIYSPKTPRLNLMQNTYNSPKNNTKSPGNLNTSPMNIMDKTSTNLVLKNLSSKKPESPKKVSIFEKNISVPIFSQGTDKPLYNRLKKYYNDDVSIDDEMSRLKNMLYNSRCYNNHAIKPDELEQVISNYALIAHVKKTPNTSKIDHKILAKYLQVLAKTDLEKAWIIYYWICSNMSWEFLSSAKDNTLQVKDALLQNSYDISLKFASLFERLGLAMGLKVRNVEGYFKGYLYKAGDKFQQCNHVWNTVFIINKWYLVDTSLGCGYLNHINSGFERNLDIFYFLTMPDKLIKTHLPVDNTWQLAEFPISKDTFESSLHISPKAIMDYNIELLSHGGGVIHTNKSRITIRLKTNENVLLDYEIYHEDMLDDNKKLDHVVLPSIINKTIYNYDIILPHESIYYFRIYAADLENPEKPPVFILSYAIMRKKQNEKEVDKPVAPEIKGIFIQKLLKTYTKPAKVVKKSINDDNIRFPNVNLREMRMNNIRLISHHTQIDYEFDMASSRSNNKSALHNPSPHIVLELESGCALIAKVYETSTCKILNNAVLPQYKDNKFTAKICFPKDGQYTISLYNLSSLDDPNEDNPYIQYNALVKGIPQNYTIEYFPEIDIENHYKYGVEPLTHDTNITSQLADNKSLCMAFLSSCNVKLTYSINGTNIENITKEAMNNMHIDNYEQKQELSDNQTKHSISFNFLECATFMLDIYANYTADSSSVGDNNALNIQQENQTTSNDKDNNKELGKSEEKGDSNNGKNKADNKLNNQQKVKIKVNVEHLMKYKISLV